ncbi:hypothetical protein [Pseudocolwellia agarivorans]|uniref:hypothetical protein n=1 Tax=Pseudocolwellia agarivorans TaxID=1911682 RepID=UPI003F8828F7
MDLNKFREELDNDLGFNSKRKTLIIVCLVFLALNLSGAKLEEANTFIFKIKFTDYQGLSFLFFTCIIFLTLRYFSYAQNYHNQLFNFWSTRMFGDYKLFYYDSRIGEVKGHLENAFDVCGGDEPGIQKPFYVISGIFQRSISYDSKGHDEEEGDFYFKQYVNLNKYNDKWGRLDYLKLLSFEFKYQFEALFKYRESLDLLSPYIISICSLISFIFKDEILAMY